MARAHARGRRGGGVGGGVGLLAAAAYAASLLGLAPAARPALDHFPLLGPAEREAQALAHDLLKGPGFNAGDGYPHIWIRDLSTFIEVALDAGNPAALARDALVGFLCRQSPEGEVPDGYMPKRGEPACAGAQPFPPGSLGPCITSTDVCKNDAETDQETSLVYAVATYVRSTNDVAFLGADVNGTSVLERLEGALEWLVARRTDAATGLLWGGTTVDWGDVQVEADIPDVRMLAPQSHPAIDPYDNALFARALQAVVEMRTLARAAGLAVRPRRGMKGGGFFEERLEAVRRAIRARLYRGGGRFRPHLYMDAEGAAAAAKMAGHGSFRNGSPFPALGGNNESRVSAHGGAACVALGAGVLSAAEVAEVGKVHAADAREVNSGGGDVTVGITVWPPYNGTAAPIEPWQYQNGGDWSWFGTLPPPSRLPPAPLPPSPPAPCPRPPHRH